MTQENAGRGPQDAEETLAFPPSTSDSEATASLPMNPGPWGQPPSPSSDDEATTAIPVPPSTQPGTASAWAAYGEDAEPTTFLPTGGAPASAEPHQTQVLPTLDPAPTMQENPWMPAGAPAPANVEWPAPTAVPEPAADAEDDLRGTDAWAWQMSRTQNRASTDVGLLLLRLFSLPLVLHGIRELLSFNEFVTQIGSNTLGALAPTVIAMAVIVAQTILPVLLAVGFGTRLAAGAQALLMGSIYFFWILDTQPIVDPSTGALSGETALAYAALALPLVFTGPGRFSLDHGLTAERRERVVRRRIEKRNRRGNA